MPAASAAACTTMQRLRPGNEPPERREEHEDRIDVRTEARDLLARRGVGHLERPALGRAPDRLDHVPEVEAVREELVVPPDRRRADDAVHTTAAPTMTA